MLVLPLHPRDPLTSLTLPSPTCALWGMALIQVVSDMEPGKRGNCHPCLLPPWLNPDGGLMGSFSTQQPPLALRCLWARLSPFGLRLLPEGKGSALPSLRQEASVQH